MKRLGHKFGVASLAFRLSFKSVIQTPILAFGQFCILIAIMTVYSYMFRGIPPENLAPYNLTAAKLSLYLITTEMVYFCMRLPYKDFQAEIQSGHLSLALLRPCPLWVIKTGEWFGSYVANFILLLVPAILTISFFAPNDLPTFSTFLIAVASVMLSGLLYTFFCFMIGGIAVWVKQADPLFWIAQKIMFLFGALMWPLFLFPSLFETIAWFTPFPGISAVPGGLMLESFNGDALSPFLYQILWFLVFVALTDRIGKNILRQVQKTGE